MRKIFLVQIFVIALALSLSAGFVKATPTGDDNGDTPCIGSVCGTSANPDNNVGTPNTTPTTTPTTTPAVTPTPASNDTTPNTNPSPAPANNGTPCDINNTSPTQICNPISVSSVPDLIVKIINYLLGIIAGLSVLMVVIAGFRMVISAGNESAVKSARQQITWAVIGLVVSVLAYSIIAIVKNAIAK